jgi:RNA polymerase sigma factor (sigma-70 family)
MAGAPDSRTHATLLARLAGSGQTDQEAWREFVHHYGRKIYRWCVHWGLQESDARDVSQQVLLKMARQMQTFIYDPNKSFRAWLKTITRNALIDFVQSWERPDRGSGDSGVQARLDSVEAREELVRQLEEQYDGELLEQAMARVRLRVASHTWEAFKLTALDGVPAAEAAIRLHMKIATVYEARSSILRKLRSEREILEKGDDPKPATAPNSE